MRLPLRRSSMLGALALAGAVSGTGITGNVYAASSAGAEVRCCRHSKTSCSHSQARCLGSVALALRSFRRSRLVSEIVLILQAGYAFLMRYFPVISIDNCPAEYFASWSKCSAAIAQIQYTHINMSPNIAANAEAIFLTPFLEAFSCWAQEKYIAVMRLVRCQI